MKTLLICCLTLISFYLSGCTECGGTFIDDTARGFKSEPGSCNNGADLSSTTTVTLNASDATLSDSAKLEVDGSEVSLKVTGTSTGDACAPGAYTVGVGLADTVDLFSQPYTPTSSYQLDEVSKARIYRTGTNVTGDAYISIQSDDGGEPSGTELGRTDTMDTSTMSTLITNVEAVALQTPLNITSGVTYHFVLVGDTNFSSSGGHVLRWAQAFNTDTNCDGGNFATLSFTDDGTSWVVANSNNKPSEIELKENTFASDSPTASYSYNSSSAETVWDLSTFNTAVNGNGETGTVTFDVGVSDSGTATYSLTGQPLSSIQAATDLTGTYLHVRVNFGSSGSVDASIGAITVGYSD